MSILPHAAVLRVRFVSGGQEPGRLRRGPLRRIGEEHKVDSGEYTREGARHRRGSLHRLSKPTQSDGRLGVYVV